MRLFLHLVREVIRNAVGMNLNQYNYPKRYFRRRQILFAAEEDVSTWGLEVGKIIQCSAVASTNLIMQLQIQDLLCES